MHRALTVAGLVLALFAGPVYAGTDAPPDARPPNLRPLTPITTRLLEEGIARSSTMREVVENLNQSDVVVYININGLLPVKYGCTQFVTKAAGWRYVLVSLNPRMMHDNLIRSLGHELYHAWEVARAPEIVDSRTFGEYFERVGARHRSGNLWYETREAQAVERRIRSELMRRGG